MAGNDNKTDNVGNDKNVEKDKKREKKLRKFVSMMTAYSKDVKFASENHASIGSGYYAGSYCVAFLLGFIGCLLSVCGSHEPKEFVPRTCVMFFLAWMFNTIISLFMVATAHEYHVAAEKIKPFQMKYSGDLSYLTKILEKPEIVYPTKAVLEAARINAREILRFQFKSPDNQITRQIEKEFRDYLFAGVFD